MHKLRKQLASGFLAAVCVLSSLSINGITVFAAEENAADSPWPSARYELEDGRIFNGEGADREIQIKTGSQFSKGKAIDTMDHNGQGAGAAVEPVITNEGLYQVVLGYSKGRAYPEGKIALYKNEERVGYFLTKTTGVESVQPVVNSDAIAVYLEAGDELSIRTDTGVATDAVACFDYLDISMWGGQYEAENARLLLDTMKTVDAENASGKKSVDGFEKVDGAGVEFPFEIPADGTYQLGLAYTRINYELADQIGVYVNNSRAAEVILKSGGNTGDYIESDPVELELKQGDKIVIMESAAEGDQGLLLLDYLKIQPKMTEVLPEGGPAFTSDLLQVVKGDVLNVPVKNLPEGAVITYSSSDESVAAVDAATGKITALQAGQAVITANYENHNFSCKLQVVSSQEDLAVEVKTYEAEAGELIAGEKGNPAIKSGSPFSGGKWVEVYDAGTGAAVKIMPEIQEEGQYLLTACYAKGSMYPNDTVSVYVNSQKIGEFKMESGSTTQLRNTNTLQAALKPGDTVMVRKDEGQNSLFRYDYLMVSPVTTVPVRSIQMEEPEVTVTNMETYEAKYTLSPSIATDDLVWSSSNTAVAQADGGMIWGRGEGDAVITAKSVYNDAVQAQMKVTVVSNNKIETIASKEMEVLIDRNYPRVMEYKMASGSTMDGNTQALDSILINGKEYKPEISFDKKTEDTAVYTINVKELNAVLTLQAKVEGTILKFDFLDIKESGNKNERIYTIELADQNLVSVSSREAAAEFAGSKMQPDITKTGDEFIDLTKGEAAAPSNYNYAFISNGKVAAGIRSNAYSMSDGDQGAPRRVIKETVSEGSAFRTSLRSGSWVWRREDYTKKFITYDQDGTAGDILNKTYEDQPNLGEMPLVYVVLAEDLNETGTVDWQDAAIRFRDVMYIAIGMDKIPDAVVQRLIMPQAGEGNYPFLSSLDETKRVYLNTDGLGQIILDKYHNLGFWGDFSVYDDHLGGLQDFQKFVSDATNDYNGFVGVHSNFTEVFAKTNQFSTESIQMNAAGTQPQSKGYKAFGFFLHQCYYADDTWEALSGQRRDAMKMFKEDVPDLGFIYSDVYYWNGWRGQKLEEDYAANGLAYFVEWPYISEEASPWAHWAVEKDYSPASNKGYSSDIARFIFNHTKDRWDNNASKCDNQRVPSSCNLLMGADTTSYEGWVHDGVNRYDYVIEKVFDNNLPTKYMQHFPILRMDKDEDGWGRHIWFEDGLEVFLDENGRRTMTKDGKLVYNEDSYLIPWDEGDMQVDNNQEEKEVKLYHWNENGTTTTWQLPDSWDDLANVYLYRLTDQGKEDQKVIPVENGSITLENIEKRVAYVVYKGEAAPAEDVAYGDGSFVKDPGFNYGSLREWKLDFGEAEVRRNDTQGDDATTQSKYKGDLRNYELVMDGADAAQVSQTISGLIPGQEYAASVMVEVEQGKEREASIQVDCADTTVKNYTTKSILKQYDAYDSKASTYMLRMRVTFTVPEGETTATVRLCAAQGQGKVRFDNVRIYDTTTPVAPDDAVNVVLYQDFEYGKRDNAPVRAGNKVTYESYYPFNLGSAGGIREARAMLQTRHDPYTQNNKNAGWDANTIMVDMALDGNHSLSVITDSIGAAFQTSPQTIRFEKGHNYRISFLYQNALDDTFAFVLGADKNSTPIYQEPLKATAAKTGSKTFTYEFTSTSDQTWFSINRIDRSVVVSENPNPFVIDNILVEDLSQFYPVTAADSEDAVITAPKQSIAGAEVKISVEVTNADKEIDKVTVSSSDAGNVEVTKISAGQYSFTMPPQAVTVTAVLKNKAADKTDLAAAIALAEEKLETSYTAQSWKPFFDALTAAQKVNGNKNAVQSEVNEALEALTEKMKQLERLPEAADKTALNAVLSAALLKDQGQYTAESWSTFETALKQAKVVSEDVTAILEKVIEARRALTDAMAQLVYAESEETVDTSLLQAVINAASSLNSELFTKESYDRAAEAKEAAKAFLTVSGGDAGQGDVNGAVEALTAALFGLVPKEETHVDRTLLDALTVFADSRQEALYTAESWAAMTLAKNTAKDVAQDADQTEVNAAADGLSKSLAALQTKTQVTPEAADRSVLNALIAAAEGKKEEDCTAKSWKVLADALAAAKTISQDAEQAVVNAAAVTLAEALEQLLPAGTVDKTDLDSRIKEAEALKKDEYTKESWKDLEGALAAAKLASADPDVTQAEVDESLDQLTKAIEALEKTIPPAPADKTELDALIQEVGGKNQDDYTAQSWDKYYNALLAAQEVSRNDKATMQQVDEAVKALREAADALEKNQPAVDKAALQAAIQEAEARNQADYTVESWSELTRALADARRVMGAMDATQSQADEYAAALKAAIDGLVQLPKAEKEKLHQTITAAEEKKASDYTEESWDVFQRALVNAKAAAGDTYATQAKVDEAVHALQTAMDALRPVENGGGNEDGNNPDDSSGGNEDGNNPDDNDNKDGNDNNGNPSADQNNSGDNNAVNGQNSGVTSARTGDPSPIMILSVVLVSSVLIVVGSALAIYKRRREEEQDQEAE